MTKKLTPASPTKIAHSVCTQMGVVTQKVFLKNPGHTLHIRNLH